MPEIAGGQGRMWMAAALVPVAAALPHNGKGETACCTDTQPQLLARVRCGLPCLGMHYAGHRLNCHSPPLTGPSAGCCTHRACRKSGTALMRQANSTGQQQVQRAAARQQQQVSRLHAAPPAPSATTSAAKPQQTPEPPWRPAYGWWPCKTEQDRGNCVSQCTERARWQQLRRLLLGGILVLAAHGHGLNAHAPPANQSALLIMRSYGR